MSQFQTINAFLIGIAFQKGFRDEANSQIVLYHRKHLIRSRRLNIWRQRDAVLGKPVGIELMGHGFLAETDNGIFC